MPQIGIPATFIAYITLQQITNLTELDITLQQITNLTQINQANVAVASDDIELDAPLDSTVLSTSYVKVKEFKVNYSGTHRIKFLLFNESGGPYTSYARIYKNGEAFGTERSTNTSAPVLFTEDLSFTSGDLIQLYVKTSGASGPAHVTTFVVCSSMAMGSVKLDNGVSGGAIGYIQQLDIGGG